MEFWLKQGTDALRLPINPPSFEVGLGNSHQTVNVQTKGDVSILGKKGLRTVEISSFFPGQDYPFAEYAKDREPYDYVNKLLTWQEKEVQLTITGTNINFSANILSFSYGEPDGTGDVGYALSMQEYRKPTYTAPKKSTGKKNKKNAKTTKTTKAKPKNYTVKKGDTLRSIAKKYYGSGSKHSKIYKANKNVIEKTAKKKGKKSSSNKGLKGYWIFPGTKLVIPK